MNTQPTPQPVTSSIAFRTFAAIFGVALPLVTLILEFFSGMCTNVFFDPIPTFVHVILIALVPLGNAVIIYKLSSGAGNSPLAGAGRLNGIAIAVSLFYTIIFLPITPFAVIGILFFGMGLLPLAPLFSFITALCLRRKFRRQFCPQNSFLAPALWKPLVLVFAVLLAMEAPKFITHAGIRMAV